MTPPSHCDALILGAGLAGVSAALWLAKFKVSHRLLDQAPQLGGELFRVHTPIRDYPGLTLAHGRELQALLDAQARELGVSFSGGVTVQRVDLDTRTAETSAGTWSFRALIIALGLRRRRLAVPGERQYFGRGVTDSASAHLDELAGRRVLVVGGGDGALENALMLAERCPEVWVSMRGTVPRARAEFVERVATQPTIHLWPQTRITRFTGDGERLTGVTLDTGRLIETHPIEAAVIKIGFEPNTDLFKGAAFPRDPEGTLTVDRFTYTGRPGVYAVGDIANPHSPSLAASAGDGARAAREVYEWLKQAR